MFRRILLAAATVVLGLALAVPVALAEGNSEPGIVRYHPQGSPCGQYHGAFGYFGKDNNLAGGANGEATGDANSAKGCQRNLEP